MELKNSITEYTEDEFIDFIKLIFEENIADTDDYLDELLEHFERITEHPEGTDIIYYAPSDSECTPEKILETIKKWRAENGKPGFKA
ncbi:Colicin immunity protein/pyocin immunity protein [Yersinia mollaretii ATCC 43969]|uniref:Colicin immunity protein/pyocin immunity protein n=1 Tax=Yersinia mollaretii (strain ATCC 43969 / DSM 18520 / CIP 103324 / CNY 7263 / WAIP 204) TaxID=349967 RepID=A0ABM9Y5T6_YERMW|nr:bacteriocin immunity protein [Yersinia mollaretii]EEQ09149.1 Colicin immunity protein/pyocin immunity protein [Yersinia mollaretii ATCC 43969]QKJ02300.1 bacteriocin immunity protein [Yersinia mollaretii ATCC 43969]